MNIVEMIKATAENQYKLMMQMAAHIEQLEQQLATQQGNKDANDGQGNTDI
jgi:hypothetical protein